MRRTLIYSSLGLIFLGAGFVGYQRLQPAGPAVQGTSSTQARSASGTSPGARTDRAPDLGSAATPTPGEPATVGEDGFDHAAMASSPPGSGKHFPDTPTGRALDQHLQILVDVNPGADARKARSLEELRRHPKEASEALLDAYHQADPADSFGRWLISLTLWELDTDEAYRGLKEIATSAVPPGLRDNDRDGSALSNESAIRQSAAQGLAALARAGNTAAESDLMSLVLDPPSGDDAVRTVAIKGYLAAGRDYEARVQTLKAQLPARYHDVVTLTISQPEDAVPPDYLLTNHKNGG